MKKFAFVSLVVSALLLLSIAAHAAPPEKYRMQGNSASAEFYSYDEATCASSYTYMVASESEQRTIGPDGTTSPFGYLYISNSTYDICNFTLLFAVFGSVELAPGELDAHPAAQWARLHKELVGYEYASGTSIPVTIDLSWAAVGEAARSHTQYSVRAPYGHVSVHYNAVSREAEVTGSIIAGTTNLIAHPLSTWAGISHSSSGTMSRD